MIANAVQHLHGHGVVTIVTENSADGVVQVKVSTIGSSTKDDRFVSSLSPETHADVKRMGTGLPLPVVNDIIVGQGGTMSWEADGAGDLRFTVSFPGINEA